MTRMVWDASGERTFETGVDRGVIYVFDPDSAYLEEDLSLTEVWHATPWNGLLSVDVTQEGGSSTPLYYDGIKHHVLHHPGDFSATIKAYTYPDSLVELEGFSELDDGVFLDNQRHKTFSMSYRTKLGDDIDGDEKGYKIHIIYNVIAIPDAISNQSVSSNISPITFGWTLEAVPKSFPGHRPTAHVIIDSTKVSPEKLAMLEDWMYGWSSRGGNLPRIQELTA